MLLLNRKLFLRVFDKNKLRMTAVMVQYDLFTTILNIFALLCTSMSVKVSLLKIASKVKPTRVSFNKTKKNKL